MTNDTAEKSVLSSYRLLNIFPVGEGQAPPSTFLDNTEERNCRSFSILLNSFLKRSAGLVTFMDYT